MTEKSTSKSSTFSLGLGLTLGTLAACSLGYFLYRRFYPKPIPLPKIQRQLLIPEINNNKLQPIARQINRQLLDIPLSQQPQILKKIYKRSIELILQQYNKLVVQQRIRRRRLIKDRVKYVRQISKQQDQKKQLKQRSMNAILAQINVSQDKWSEAVLIWQSLDQNNQQDWNDLIIQMENCLLEQFQLKSKKIPLEKILQTHVKLLKSFDTKKQEFRDVPQDDLSIVTNIMISDELYLMYEFEKEDVTAALDNMKQEERVKFEKYLDEIEELGNQIFESQVIESERDSR